MSSILTVNAGSSSVRIAAFRVIGGDAEPLARARLEASERSEADVLSDFLEAHGLGDPDIVAHRVVHGGALTESCCITGAVEEEILRAAALAPLHNRRALAWIAASRTRFGPDVRQAAVFDTAFFAALPRVATTYALPADLAEAHGLRRFGFHGLAHRSMLRDWERHKPQAAVRASARGSATAEAGVRLITIQLGSGCSMAAICDGRPIDTSMGFTPLEGLVMGTRPGDLDPGLLLYLQQQRVLSVERLDRMLSHEAGLLGLSGRSADMRDLLAQPDSAARLAVDVYCYRVRKYIGAYLAALNGADAILFGGGVGENAPEIRERILSDLDQLGIRLDRDANRRTAGVRGTISAAASPVAIGVVPVDEERAVVDDVLALVHADADVRSAKDA